MAGIFKIHLDNDSESRFQEIKPKEIKAIGKRCALRQITDNHVKEPYKTFSFATSKIDGLSRDLSLLSNGLTENIKALELQEKDKKNVNKKQLKTNSIRSPLKDLRSNERVNSEEPAEKIHSPMSIDKSPNTKYDCKENVHSKPLNKNIKTLTKLGEKVSNLKNNNALVIGSPMSVDSSPIHPSKGESALPDIEDLCGYITYKEDIYKYLRRIEATSKIDGLSRDLSLLSNGLTENIKAIELQEKDKKNVNKKQLKTNSIRSLLKDLRSNERVNSEEPAEKIHSPMSIDKSPNAKYECKENVLSKPLNNNIKTLTKLGEKVSNLKNINALVIGSPMSVDSSPIHPSKGESALPDIEDLCGYITYKEDIYKYLRRFQKEFRPKAYYMRRQPDVTYSMRTILVDWLVEVGGEFKLKNETLNMAVSYIDRFLSTMAVAKPKLQLLGTSALFIAAKFEEIYPPEVVEFTYITDDSYSVKQLLRMERLILKVLSFDLSCPTSYTFIMHISSCIKLPSKIIFLAMYICELTLLESDPYLEFNPSLIACGAIALSRRCLDYSDVWPSPIAKIAGYTFLQLGPVVNHLNETHHKSFTLSQTAIRQKYGVAEYEYVSQVPFKKLVVRDSFVN